MISGMSELEGLGLLALVYGVRLGGLIRDGLVSLPAGLIKPITLGPFHRQVCHRSLVLRQERVP